MLQQETQLLLVSSASAPSVVLADLLVAMSSVLIPDWMVWYKNGIGHRVGTAAAAESAPSQQDKKQTEQVSELCVDFGSCSATDSDAHDAAEPQMVRFHQTLQQPSCKLRRA
eukprot:SAG31_NODE_120_length_23892_cov_10.545623_15_plen_112_part_00